MDLGKRLMGVGDRVREEAKEAADRVRGELAEMVVGPDGQTSVEGFILGVVRSARSDDDEDEQSEKEVRKAARKRRRRLGLASLATGPFAGMTGEITDLYGETATVVDVVELHGLPLTDAQIGGHMVVLWGLADDPAKAAMALEGTGPALVELLAGRVAADYQAADSVPAKVKVIWHNRDLMANVREAATSGPLKRVLRAGRDAKELIERAELQLGVRQA